MKRPVSRRVRSIIALATLMALLAACAGPNYDGTGNEFVVTGTITQITDQSVILDQIQVEQAAGKAQNWFSDRRWLTRTFNNHQQLHDNYTTTLGKQTTVGHVFQAGQPITLQDLAVGRRIRATGKIRETSDGDESTIDHAVFDRIDVILQ